MPTVVAKVRPLNNYGGNAPAGSLIEVEQAEIDRVPWCLERVADALPVFVVDASDLWGRAHSPGDHLNDDGLTIAEEAARVQAEADAKATAAAAQSKVKGKGK